ncbi:hypothetical protein PRNP1_012010 [Phytophthora ramorum]
MPAGLKTPFQPGHDILYGLEVTERNPETSAVVSVACRFCIKFGREAKPNAKRKRTKNVHHFVFPFRVDNYKRHLTAMHPKLWKEYSDASPEDKRNFFDGAADVNEPDADADADQVENQLWKDKLADRLMNQPLYPYGWKVAKAFENGWAKVGVIEGYARVGGLLKWAVDFPGGLTLQLECMELVELLQSSILSGLKITGGTNPWYEDM